MNNENTNMRKWALVVVLTALACITTMVIRIPIPATTGYFNIGDVFVLLAGLWLGPKYGLIVGAVGPTIADAVGYPQFILATAITKGMEGLITGYLAQHTRLPKIVSAGVGAVIMVAGYFIFEAFIYPAIGTKVPFFAVTNLAAAFLELLPNAIQGLIGATVAYGLWNAIPSKK